MQDTDSRGNCSDVHLVDEDEDSKIFPQRLMEILSDETFAESICWLPHGQAFMVRNRNLFVEQVMPRFFTRKAKYSSFMRKLKRWNFHRVSRGAESGAYYNDSFRRDKPQLVAQMFCQNARTKMAMSNTNNHTNSPSSCCNNTISSTNNQAAQTPPGPSLIRPSVLAALCTDLQQHQQHQKQRSVLFKQHMMTETEPSCSSSFKLFPSGKFSASWSLCANKTRLQSLEHQMQVIQQEYAQRMYWQREQLKSARQRQMLLQQQRQLLAIQQEQSRQQQMSVDAAMAATEMELLRMQHLCELRALQTQGLVPNNDRASAA